MSKSSTYCISKLWNRSVFSVLSKSGKEESQTVQECYQSILNAFSSFEKTLKPQIDKLQSIKLNTPCLSRLRLEIFKMRARMQKFMDDQNQILNDIFTSLSEFRFIIQKSEMKALKEYIERIDYFTSKTENNVTIKNIVKVQDQIISLKLDEKLKIKSDSKYSNFQRWLADFDFRSQTFFINAYGINWDQQSKNLQHNFIKLKPQASLSNFTFQDPSLQDNFSGQTPQASPSQIIKQQDINLQREGQQKWQMEEQIDIVSQIFQELEKVSRYA